MTTSIKCFNTKIVLSERGVTLQKRFSGRKLKFLTWEEIKAVGFYVGYVPAMGIDVCTLSPKVLPEFYVSYYDDLNIFVYFSSVRPVGFGLEDVLPVFRDERSVCLNLGCGQQTSLSTISKIARKTAQKIRKHYSGDIINVNAVYHK